MTASILVVDDQESIRHFISKNLEDEGFHVSCASSGKEALVAIRGQAPDLVLLDLRLPDLNGLEVLRKAKEEDKEQCVIIMTAFGDVDSAVKAMKYGAFDYVNKPINLDQLQLMVEKALESQTLRRELKHFRERRFSKDFIRGQSPLILRIYDMVDQVAKSESTSVLIEGESGTGKELIANLIHDQSARREKPFLDINCAAIPRELLESELFGHEKGAFTDAKAQKQGLLELADGGTVFLDEVGEMGLNIQVKLLRVLERMSFKRVGGTKDIEVSVRIISATNRDLEALVRKGQFREDLYYRLKVIPIRVPALRERREDIIPLAKHFMHEFNKAFGKSFSSISPDAEKMLLDYPWPGNIRELRNLFERTVLLEDGNAVEPAHLKLSAAERGEDGKSIASKIDELLSMSDLPPGGIPLEDIIEELERSLINKAFMFSNRNQSRTAQLLNMKRDRLRYRMKIYGMKSENDN
jgi:two-component system response regulator AtoC